MDLNERRTLERERKILRVREKVEGGLGLKDQERLSWIEERLRQEGQPGKPERRDPRKELDAVMQEESPEASLDSLFDDKDVHRPTGTGSKPIDVPADEAKEDTGEPAGMANSGPLQAIVHFKTGKTQRGTITNLDTDAPVIRLDPPGGGSDPPKEIPTDAVSHIVVMTPRKRKRKDAGGKKVRLRFQDGKTLNGVTPDHEEGWSAFTVVPVADRYIERVIVYRNAIKSLELED
jgi:hypothetical protein